MEPSKAGPLEVLPRDVSPGYVSWARAPGSETLQTSRTRKGGAHHPLGNPSRDGAGQQSCPQVWLSGQVTCPVSKIASYLPGPQGQHSRPSPAEGPRPGGSAARGGRACPSGAAPLAARQGPTPRAGFGMTWALHDQRLSCQAWNPGGQAVPSSASVCWAAPGPLWSRAGKIVALKAGV